jgi:hypothetical protein
VFRWPLLLRFIHLLKGGKECVCNEQLDDLFHVKLFCSGGHTKVRFEVILELNIHRITTTMYQSLAIGAK